MKIIASYFNRNKKYGALRTVFEKSANKHMPGVPVEILDMEMPINIDRKRDTAFAFFAAAKYALASKEPLIICDIDLMFTGDISTVFSDGFDVGITTREEFKHPFNTGVWWYNPTQQAREFVSRWIDYTQVLVDSYTENYEFIQSHGGIDQASLAMTINEKHDAKVSRYRCDVYNAEQSCWKDMDESTKVVHIKSGLRQYALTGKTSPKLIEQWPDDNHRKRVYNEFRGYL